MLTEISHQAERMMWVRILRQTFINGQPARVGDVVKIHDLDAMYCIATGKAEKVEDLSQSPAMVPAPEARQPRTRKPSART